MTGEIHNLVTARGLTKIHHRGDFQVKALENTDIDINRGDFSVICGPSGSGKSTLLNIIGLLEPPDQGAISINGNSIEFNNKSTLNSLRRDNFGFVFQNFNLIPVLTALENVELPLYEKNLSASSRRDRAAELLTAVGLSDRFHNRPNQLSGGQQQRVAVARALVANPSIVLADEPTANLDSTTSESLLELMLKLNRDRGCAFVIATHDPRVVRRAQRVIHITDGQITS
jgi:putative ABC transport system ATP-binding protein